MDSDSEDENEFSFGQNQRKQVLEIYQQLRQLSTHLQYRHCTQENIISQILNLEKEISECKATDFKEDNITRIFNAAYLLRRTTTDPAITEKSEAELEIELKEINSKIQTVLGSSLLKEEDIQWDAPLCRLWQLIGSRKFKMQELTRHMRTMDCTWDCGPCSDYYSDGELLHELSELHFILDVILNQT